MGTPAVGTGIGMQEIIKTTAAIRPPRGLKEISLRIFFLTGIIHMQQMVRATTNHNTAQFKGSMPSEICMAYAFFPGSADKTAPKKANR